MDAVAPMDGGRGSVGIAAMSKNRGVLVKVNAFVDAGIADLVSVLSKIDGLVTLESQGGAGDRDASVTFRYGDWWQCGEFLFEQILPRMPADLRAGVSLKLQAHGTDAVEARITMEQSAVPEFAACVRHVLGQSGATGVLPFEGRRRTA